MLDPRLAQTSLQPGGTKRIWHLLLDQLFTGQWRESLLKFHPRLLRPEHRVGRTRQVLHMKQRPPGTPPGPEQFKHALFSLWIVSPPQPWFQNAFLLIDDDQCCVSLELHADFPHATLVNVPHLSINPHHRQAFVRQILK
ncbi:hypothetical protein D3C73_1335920 [compost metagenome]